MSEELESTNSTLSVRTRELTNAHSLKLHVRSNTCRVDHPGPGGVQHVDDEGAQAGGQGARGARCLLAADRLDDRISLLTEEETCEGGATDKEWLSFLD